jgi:hypothetical protein
MAEPAEVIEGSDGHPIIRVHDSIERDPDPVQSSRWQAEPPEEDGLYVGVWVDGFTFLVEFGALDDVGRVAISLSDGEVIELDEVSWWLVPAIPPIPEEEP